MSRGAGMEQARAVEDLIGGIYDAAADPELWSNAIGQIVEATGCRTGVDESRGRGADQPRWPL